MASIEFLQNRINGAETNLEKLNKKLERIRKVEAQNWEDPNPYCYSEYDLRSTLKEIEQAQRSLEGYKSKLQAETEKANSRNVQPILDFLEYWKCEVRKYYDRMLVKYIIAKAEYHEADRAYCAWYNSMARREASVEERKERDAAHRKLNKNFHSTWNFIFDYVIRVDGEDVLDDEKLHKMLNREAEAKYDDIVERTNAVVGQITDASQLRVSAKGELNGIIVGTRGSAKVETIGAGGYNDTVILDSGRHGQIFHYRTLIHKLS